MTVDEVQELAKKANISVRGHYDETGSTLAELKRFAELVQGSCGADTANGLKLSLLPAGSKQETPKLEGFMCRT